MRVTILIVGAIFLVASSFSSQQTSLILRLGAVVEAKKPIRPATSGSRPRPTTARATTTTQRARPASRSSGNQQQQQRKRPPVDDDEDDDEAEFADLSDESSPTTLLVEEDEEDDSFVEAAEEERRVLNQRKPPQQRSTARPAASRLSRERSTRNNIPRRGPATRPSSPTRPRRYEEEEDNYEEEVNEEEFDDEEDGYTGRRASSSRRAAAAAAAQPAARRGSRNPPRRGGPSPRGPPPSRRGGSVVPYTNKPAGASAFLMKGLSSVMSALPDPATVKEAAVSGLTAARETTSHLSSNLYREVKGLTSSELEQVMLKATRPDDTPVKGKHVERLVGVTYQISGRYDLYDAVLRKLWSKMAERDWRTTIKAVYLLHRFAADGAPAHAPALKARLRELRRTRDPKRKDKYFNSKQLLAVDAQEQNLPYRAFLSRYAHYVLLRSQSFGGMFDEIAQLPSASQASTTSSYNKGKASDKKSVKAAAAAAAAARKPLTSTCLRAEYLNAAIVLLKAGTVCTLKDGEECENTAIASERVASDLIGLTTAVAIALNRALKDNKSKNDPVLLKKWCLFYRDELLPQTKAMVKKLSPKLDAYGLFLPSRMGASVAPDLLEKGLQGNDEEEDAEEEVAAAEQQGEQEEEDDEEEDATPSRRGGGEEVSVKTAATTTTAAPTEEVEKPVRAAGSPAGEAVAEEDEAVEEEAGFDEEYEYEEEEYYDDEE